MAAVVFCGVDGGVSEEGVVAGEVDQDAVDGVAGFDLAHGAGEDEVAVVDEADVVAELFDLIHSMGGEEDGAALLAEIDEGVHEEDGVDGIEAAEGLVHDDEFGLVEKRGDELNLLLHALGELFGLFVNGSVISSRSHQRWARLRGGGRVEAVELAEEDELVHDLHLLVEAALFGQVADAL